VREELGEVAVLGWHHAVPACPGDEGWTLQARQPLRRPEQQIAAGECCSQKAHGVAADLGLLQNGFIHRAVTASPRMVSHPDAIGSRRRARSRPDLAQLVRTGMAVDVLLGIGSCAEDASSAVIRTGWKVIRKRA
jgi:hypothetical protein